MEYYGIHYETEHETVRHSDVYLGSDASDGIRHWKYIRKYKAPSGKWVYVYASKKTHQEIERNQKQPFFLYLAYNAPHTPLQATEKYLKRFEHIKDNKRKTYAAMVSAVDDGVGNVLNKLKELNGNEGWVVKAQVHAGGRGKGGGVKFSPNIEKLKENAGNIIGMQLVTPQTSAEGKKVNFVLVAEDVYYPGETETKEFYVSILLDRAQGKNMIVYSTEGGMDIEHVAEVTPHLIHNERGSRHGLSSALGGSQCHNLNGVNAV